MSDTLITIIAIALAALLMFVSPLMTMADRTDDVSQIAAQTAVTEFINDVRTTGKITPERYNQLAEDLNATGNLFDVELEIQILDQNPGKKGVQVVRDKVGENVYYTVYTSQILEDLEKNNQPWTLKEGDIITCKVKNANPTLSQQLKNFFYMIVGNDTYTIVAEDSGMITITGVK